MHTELPAGRDRSLCWPIRLIATMDCSPPSPQPHTTALQGPTSLVLRLLLLAGSHRRAPQYQYQYIT